jgi:hypothetical protein
MFQLRHKTIEKYIVLPDTDRRTRSQKWEDPAYLQAVRDFARNNVFATELMHALESLREKADNAATPDELKGYREGLRAIKTIMFAPAEANKRLQMIEQMRENGEE